MKNLLKKLSEIRKQTGFIKKAKVGENLTYKAVSADMVLFEVRNLVDNQNLFLSTQVLKEELEIKERTEMRWNKYEKKEEQKYLVNYITKLDILYTWYDVESGESLDVQWKCTAHNTDPAKSNGSALTYAEKYFFLKYFNIISSENEKLDPDCQKVEEVEKTKQQDINKKPIPETKPESLTKQVINDIIKPMVEQVSKNTEQKPELNQNFNYKPSETVNWINTKTKKPVPEKAVYNAITKAFLGIYENENLNKENKVIKVLEIVQTYIETFEGLTLKENVLKVPYEIILKDIEKL